MADSDLNDYERDLLANVEEHGWQATHVFNPKGDAPDFCYSVGFSKTLGCPEFIIFGLGGKLMHSVLWSVFRQIKAGKQPDDQQNWSGLIDGFDCVSRTVHPTNMVREYLNSAMWFWRNHSGAPTPRKPSRLCGPAH